MHLKPLLAALLAAGCSLSSLAQSPRQISVPTEVEFDVEGQARSLRFINEKSYSEAFMAGLRERVLRLRIPAPQWQQQPASLRTGLTLRIEVDGDSKSPQVRLAGMQMEPLVLKRDVAPIPEVHDDFDKTYLVHCEVDADGVCQIGKIETEGPVEEASRRWVQSTMRLWRFQPPTLNGNAIPSQVVLPLRLLGKPTAEQAPPDFRTRR